MDSSPQKGVPPFPAALRNSAYAWLSVPGPYTSGYLLVEVCHTSPIPSVSRKIVKRSNDRERAAICLTVKVIVSSQNAYLLGLVVVAAYLCNPSSASSVVQWFQRLRLTYEIHPCQLDRLSMTVQSHARGRSTQNSEDLELVTGSSHCTLQI